MLTLSPEASTLIDVLQLRFGVSIDAYDAELRPADVHTGPRTGTVLDQPGIRERCEVVLKSAESRLERVSDQLVGFFPLVREREVIGIVLVTPRGAPAESPAAHARRLDTAGRLARAVLEHDLAVAARLLTARASARRLQGILRFLTQMARYSEQDLFQAVVDAAAVWFNLDCRIYRRERSGDYALCASLPGLDRSESKPRLAGGRVRDFIALHRLTSSSDLEAAGWAPRRGDVLAWGLSPAADFVMMVGGAIDEDVEVAFDAIAHVLERSVPPPSRRAMERWQRTLNQYASAGTMAPERLLLTMVQEVAVAAGASGAWLSLEMAGAKRMLAAVSPAPGAVRPDQHPESRAHLETFAAAHGHAQLGLVREDGEYSEEVLATVEGWVAAVQPWLNGLAVALAREPFDREEQAQALAFQRRIQDEVERAKRFNLGLGLILINREPRSLAYTPPLDTLMAAVRPELRASDLIGEVRGGMLAAVLVHAEAESVESVTARLRRRLTSVLAGSHHAVIQLGHAVFSADCASADALIERALGTVNPLPDAS